MVEVEDVKRIQKSVDYVAIMSEKIGIIAHNSIRWICSKAILVLSVTAIGLILAIPSIGVAIVRGKKKI